MHWQPRESAEHAKVGLALCAFGERWKFYAPQHSCERFEKAPKEIREARVKWMRRKEPKRAPGTVNTPQQTRQWWQEDDD